MTIAFLSLGSNIQPERKILEAVELLSRYVKIVKSSTVYLTEPLGNSSQPDYYNCVLEIQTDMEPRKLKFGVLRNIENQLGRKRVKDKFAPRTIDLDILLHDDLYIVTEDLVIPDPEIEERAFLAQALYEIEPELLLPPKNKPIKEIAEKFKDQGIIRLVEFTEILRRLIKNLGI